MGRNNYSDELMRAWKRTDAAKLRDAVQAYYEWSKLTGKEQEGFRQNDGTGIEIFYSTHDDPDLGIALVVLAGSMIDDPGFLGLVAAGPLEDILWKPSTETIDRVVAEARKNARFRWMLTGVWLHSISDLARPYIVDVLGSMTENDPLPPRPV